MTDDRHFGLTQISFIIMQILKQFPYIFWSNQLNKMVLLNTLLKPFWKINIVQKEHAGNLGTFRIGYIHPQYIWHLFT